MAVPDVVCLRPDGQICEHDEKSHGGEDPMSGRPYCWRCWVDGNTVYGPFIHDWNPHVWTVIGWMPTDRVGGPKDGPS